MTVRFQADADLDARIIRGLKRRQPQVEIQTAAEGALPGLADPEVLRVAVDSRRILVTHDQRTMPRHFAQFIAGQTSAGVWAASQAEEWHTRYGHR